MELDGKKQDGSAFQHIAMSPAVLQSCLTDQCCQGPNLWSLCLTFVLPHECNKGSLWFCLPLTHFCVHVVSGIDDELEICVLDKYGIEFCVIS